MTETENAALDRADRKMLRGVVVSDKMNKTRVVKVERVVRHRFYQKVMKLNSKFSAHDESNASHEGDQVEIMSTRPLSKTKRWRIVRVVKAAPRDMTPAATAKAAA